MEMVSGEKENKGDSDVGLAWPQLFRHVICGVYLSVSVVFPSFLEERRRRRKGGNFEAEADRSNWGNSALAQSWALMLTGKKNVSVKRVIFSLILLFVLFQITAKLKSLMMTEGSLMVSYQPLGDRPNFFRSIISNAACTEEDVDFMLEEMDRLGREL